MRIRRHQSFSHGLRPGEISDINCSACQREQEGGTRPVITGQDAATVGVEDTARTACTEWVAVQVQRGRRLRDASAEEVFTAGYVTGFRVGRGGLVRHEWERLLQLAVNGHAIGEPDPAQNEQDGMLLRRAYEQLLGELP